MAQKTKARRKESEPGLEQLQGRLDVLDQRLDDLDSMVTAIAERVMSRPLSIVVTCPHCGKSVDIAMVGSEKMLR